MTVVDIASPNPRVIDSAAVGIIPEGLALSPNGDYVAVSLINGTSFPKSSPLHHDATILKILRLTGSHLTPVAEARVSPWCQRCLEQRRTHRRDSMHDRKADRSIRL